MKMKRICAILLAGVMAAGCLSGCGQSSEEESKASRESTTSSSVADTTESSQAEEKKGPVTTDPITISILTTRMDSATNDAEDIWFFKYLEYWMNEQGYNITLEVTQTEDANQQLSLMLATDNLPDIVWGPALSNTNAVMYGAGDGIVLDWTPYINEETMPNLCAMLEDYPDAITASTCVDGKIYGLPYFAERNDGEAAGNLAGGGVLFLNKNWLQECNLEEPATWDDFVDMLRTFKENIKLDNGEEVVPLLNVASLFERYVWTGMGYYGATTAGKYGTNLMIKDEQVTLPAYTEDYQTYIEIMKQLYDEGLISKDFYTMDDTTTRGMISAGVCGAFADYMLTMAQPTGFADWVSAEPIAIGDNEVHASASSATTINRMWASANTEYPEVLAVMLDYIYSPEGRVHYWYGPMEGEDPLNMVDGWYFKEDGTMTTKLIEDGYYEDYMLYAEQYILSCHNTAPRVGLTKYAMEMAGLDYEENVIEQVDSVTGDVVMLTDLEYKEDNSDGYTRLTWTDKWADTVTYVKLPTVFMIEEDATRATELKTVISEHITAESAKFITGVRPVSEIEAFQQELKALGVEEYIEMYREAYSVYMDSIFN